MHDTFVETALGTDVLLLHGMTGYEALSRPFSFTVTLVSDVRKNQPIAKSSLLGTLVKISLAGEYSADPSLGDKPLRYFNGHATRVALQEDQVGNFRVYQVELRPWLWLLDKATDCRIFQNKTVPQIAEQIFQENGFSDFRLQLGGSYPPREYCVQYRESAFAFVSRLLEHEGIYYYFEFSADKHTLVLTDGTTPHQPRPKYETIDYGYTFSGDRTKESFGGRIVRWRPRQELCAGRYASRDYDFKKPSTPLNARQNGSPTHVQGTYEHYDYPGGYTSANTGEKYASIRLQEEQAHHEMFEANATSHGLAPGYVFTLDKYPVAAQNGSYLTVEAHYDFALNLYEAANRLDVTPDTQQAPGAADLRPRDYSCTVTALQAETPFRPARTTPRPVVAGLQTAQVVGPKGEEIWTDQYGRIKVQFHWDREGKFDQSSSCWIRSAQTWAGAGWGTQHVPRIGDEVVVSFLEGDPDRPLATGSVYNGKNPPPFALPTNMATSGVKSRSTKDGGRGYNEFSLDDTKGAERVFVHAERDLDTTVKHDQTIAIDGKATETVQGDKTVKVQSGSRCEVALDILEQAGKRFTLRAGQSLELTAGAASIVLNASGAISIRGTSVAIDAPTIRLSGGANLSLIGATIQLTAAAALQATAPVVTLTGATTLSLAAPLIKQTGLVIGPFPIPAA